MTKTELDDLLRTVEEIRHEMHPDLDAGFIEGVVAAEDQNPEDDAEALRAIEIALKKYLAVRGLS